MGQIACDPCACALLPPNSPPNLTCCLQDLTCSGQLSYLGTSWRKDVAFAGYGVPLQVRLTVLCHSHVLVTLGSLCAVDSMSFERCIWANQRRRRLFRLADGPCYAAVD